jgi:SnoaL-like domain
MDQLAIERVANAIDRAVDEKAWGPMQRLFARRLTVDIGAVTGVEIIEMEREAFVAEIAALNVAGKRSYHIHYNSMVCIDKGTASLTAHSYGWNYCEQLAPPLYEVWGTMDYRFVREADGWLVNHIAMTKWREAGNTAVSAWRG